MEDKSLLEKNIEITIPPNGIGSKINELKKAGKTPVVKLGFDPTAPDLHLGHAVVLRKLRDFQRQGCEIIVIIGDFTARIGDPTGRNSLRPPLSAEKVAENAQTYIEQLSKVLDIEKITIKYNSEWLDKMGFADVVDLMSKATLAQIMQRSDFNNRSKANVPIHMHELLYPLMQGYDSVIIDADFEIGGTDQLFNCQIGRSLQSIYGRDEQVVVGMPLLVGLDGIEKMSKSKNNYVGLTDTPNDMYGKIMSLPDNLIQNYLMLASNFEPSVIDHLLKSLAAGDNPMGIKKRLAANIVEQYHGEEAAKNADLFFYNQFQNKDHNARSYIPLNISKIFGEKAKIGIVDICRNIRPELSKGEIRRLIHGQAVKIDGDKINDPLLEIKRPEPNNEMRVQIGKANLYVFVDRGPE